MTSLLDERKKIKYVPVARTSPLVLIKILKFYVEYE